MYSLRLNGKKGDSNSMDYYNMIERIYSLSVPLGMIAYFLNAVFIRNIIGNYQDDNVSKKNMTQNTFDWVLIMKSILKIITIICFFVIIALGIYYKFYILILLFFISQMIEQFNSFFYNLTKVKNSFCLEISKKLSMQERGAIVGLFGLTFFINLYKIPNAIIFKIESLNNWILSDLLLINILMFFSMVYFFFAFFSMYEISNFLIAVIKSFLKKIRANRLMIISKLILLEINKEFSWDYISVSYCYKMKKHPVIIMTSILPVMLIDIFIKILYCSYRMLLRIGYNIVVFFNYITIFLFEILDKIRNISDRKIIFIFLRGSFILSIVLIIIYNRYNPILKLSSEGTAVLEFLSSAILIPLLLSWILELKNK